MILRAIRGLAPGMLFAAVAHAGESKLFAAALAKAQANTKSTAGAEYDGAFGRSFGSRHADTMGRCTSGASGRDLETFDLVARVADNGTIETVMVSPETKVAVCLRDSMARSDYPRPPSPHYAVSIHMRIK